MDVNILTFDDFQYGQFNSIYSNNNNNHAVVTKWRKWLIFRSQENGGYQSAASSRLSVTENLDQQTGNYGSNGLYHPESSSSGPSETIANRVRTCLD